MTFENPFWILPICEKYGGVWGSEGRGMGLQLLSQWMDTIREWHIQRVIKSDDFYPLFWRLCISFTIYPSLVMPLGNHFTIGLGHFLFFRSRMHLQLVICCFLLQKSIHRQTNLPVSGCNILFLGNSVICWTL